MRKTSRWAIALAGGAFLALAVAVPVVAGTLLGDPAITGYARMYQYTPGPPAAGGSFGDGWEAVRPGKVRVAFDTTSDPYHLKYLVTAAGLKPGMRYALLNPQALYDDEPPWLIASILSVGTASRGGTLTLKGAVGAGEVVWSLFEYYQKGVARTSGADLWLFPDEKGILSGVDDDHWFVLTWYGWLPENYPGPEPGWVYAAQGLPAMRLEAAGAPQTAADAAATALARGASIIAVPQD